jgi:peptide/nickel transport system substrate-binding protein
MANDLNPPVSSTNRRHFLMVSAGMVAAGTGVGSQAQTRPSPPAKPTGQVVVGLSQEPTVFNPLMPGIEVDEAIWMSVFDCLWFADPSGKLIPTSPRRSRQRRTEAFPRAAWPGR